ncbi:MAG: hypothetical protein RIT38_835 [Bacteroidota bacterium]|jgi:hypothetical protein
MKKVNLFVGLLFSVTLLSLLKMNANVPKANAAATIADHYGWSQKTSYAAGAVGVYGGAVIGGVIGTYFGGNTVLGGRIGGFLGGL